MDGWMDGLTSACLSAHLLTTRLEFFGEVFLAADLHLFEDLLDLRSIIRQTDGTMAHIEFLVWRSVWLPL